jgi:carbon storage regulator
MIGDKVVITIVDIRGDKVRLGIEAPQEVPVHRQEVYEAIKREGRSSGQCRNREPQPAASNGSSGQDDAV